jgi:hypothetical protein
VIRVIFDQPVTAKQAGQLITVVADNIPDHEQKDKPERTIAAKFSNGQGKRVEGYTLNPRQVIEVRGDGKFAAGEGIAVEVDGTTRRYTIAGPLTLAKLSCGYSYEKSVCEVSGTALRTDGREVVLEYSNPLAVSDKQIKEAISVSPPLANMNVWSGGQLGQHRSPVDLRRLRPLDGIHGQHPGDERQFWQQRRGDGAESDDGAAGSERVDARGGVDPRRRGLARVHGDDPQRGQGADPRLAGPGQRRGAPQGA